jgi:2-oxoglutarate dehydrogenase E2 component (dihydrolipoamide succinyltransferase)
MPIELKVPAIGESVSEIYIGKWYKAEGDSIAPDEGLVELESDKATLDVPAPSAGVLKKILKQTGDTAQVGEVIAHIDSAAEGTPPGETASAAAPVPEQTPKTVDKPAEPKAAASPAPPAPAPAEEQPKERPRVELVDDGPRKMGSVPSESGPVVEHRTAPPPESKIQADGANARQARAATQARTSGDVDRLEETVPLSPIRRRIAARLVEAQHNAALLTTFNEIDMSTVKQLRADYGESFQKRHGVKLGFMSFFVKAAIESLRQCPELNAIIEDDQIVYRRYYDIGVAIGSDRGLVVPVLRNAETMSFAQIESTIEDLAKRAHTGALRVEELQGGTFTITNGGVYGSLLSTPIVNPPQSGVLGMHSIQNRPIAVDNQVVIRPMMYVALTYDHRIVDGREAVTFLRRIKEAIESPARMLLEV